MRSFQQPPHVAAAARRFVHADLGDAADGHELPRNAHDFIVYRQMRDEPPVQRPEQVAVPRHFLSIAALFEEQIVRLIECAADELTQLSVERLRDIRLFSVFEGEQGSGVDAVHAEARILRWKSRFRHVMSRAEIDFRGTGCYTSTSFRGSLSL